MHRLEVCILDLSHLLHESGQSSIFARKRLLPKPRMLAYWWWLEDFFFCSPMESKIRQVCVPNKPLVKSG